MRVDDSYDVIVVGSGFGSLFFLDELLRQPGLRVLLLERGERWDHLKRIQEGSNSPIDAADTFVARPRPGAEDKVWNFTIGLGGGTNCWYAQTPRPLPSDFAMRSRFGVAQDWPFDYDALEPHLARAEALMSVAGDGRIGHVSPRSGPYPQPPHRFSSVDREMVRSHPEHHFALPTARARVATERRPACCATFRCDLCPVNAKFTGLNDMALLFANPAVTVLTGARVRRLHHNSGVVQAVEAEVDGTRRVYAADLVVLGANAIHSPAILQASGMADENTGRYLHESCGSRVEVLLDGLDNFDGSTVTTGINYALAQDDTRDARGAAVLFFENRWTFGLRAEPGRWRQSAPITLVVEDLPNPDNTVTLGGDGEPVVTYNEATPYAKQGTEAAVDALPALLAGLPVEDIRFHGYRRTESHLQGTLRMGNDPATSVVDADQVHHRYRNLVVVGSSVFPSCLNANPSLTVAALSLKAACAVTGAKP
ncbi:GMC oxidoreductase [Acuticoccus sp.]|uniref:GMC oxidoreductase n=1 Tax=Acuticoccus sp. TaxID=1904378 RepID=UPI003B523382